MRRGGGGCAWRLLLPLSLALSQLLLLTPCASAAGCGSLSKDLLQKHAKDNVILVMVVDEVLLRIYAQSWLDSVKNARISNYAVGALDPSSSLALSAMVPNDQCFNAEDKDGTGLGKIKGVYKWGSDRFMRATWKKVYIVQQIYDLGFHVLFSDADVTWMHDPLPYFLKFTTDTGPPHVIFATDSLITNNQPGDEGLEKGTSPFHGINTGVYFIKQYAGGSEFFKMWLSFQKQRAGHDQDGVNLLVRGSKVRNNFNLSEPLWDKSNSFLWAAMHNTTAVSYLPVHVVSNSYTYHVGQVHKKYNSTLLAVHWVWSGMTPESKVANMRNAMSFSDAPSYYNAANLSVITMDLDIPNAPPDYNERRTSETESMVRFHLQAATYQLQQAYFGIMAATALRRTFVLPDFHCFCTKNWYISQACRINGERNTQFPFRCMLSDVLRSRLLSKGIEIPLSPYDIRTVQVREWPFLQHPKVPDAFKQSRIELVPEGPPRSQLTRSSVLSANVTLTQLPGGSLRAGVPWPLNTKELEQLVASHFAAYRVIHLTNATQLLSKGWDTGVNQRVFSNSVQKYASRWCCRDRRLEGAQGKPRDEHFRLVPERWWHMVDSARQEKRSMSRASVAERVRQLVDMTQQRRQDHS